MRKVIGLIPLYDDDKESYWMLPGYMKVIEECGALPIMLPLTTDTEELREYFELCDGLLMTGGHDVNPGLYKCARKAECGTTSDDRDEMEMILFYLAHKADKPVLGICRGIQLINVLLGGTLYQDLPSEYPTSTEHHMNKPYDRNIHTVNVLENTPLADIYGAGIHGVNSYHHQAIKEIAESLEPMAISEDGLVEGVYIPNKRFICAVQWHPEFAYEKDENCRKLVQAFVDAC